MYLQIIVTLRYRRQEAVGIAVAEFVTIMKLSIVFDKLFLLMQAKLNVIQSIQRFLNKYGFRCINELKLEEHTLHDDPGFVLDTIAGQYRYELTCVYACIIQPQATPTRAL